MKKVLILIFKLFLIFIVFIAAQVPSLAETFWSNENKDHYSLANHTLLFVISSIVVVSFTYGLYRWINGTKISEQKLTLRNLLFALALAISSQLAQLIITYLTNTNDRQNNYEITEVLTSKTPLIMITLVSLIIISPILEELIFQGMFQGGLLKKLNPILNIILVSITFTFIHGYSLSWSSFELLISTLSYAITYYQTKDIKMAIVCHSISNLITTCTIL